MFTHLQQHVPQLILDEDDRHSSVVIPLVKNTHGYDVLFQVRSHKLRSQPGEICFPGGRIHLDETYEAAAIRETKEELCLGDHQLRIHGPLDYIYTPGHMMVHPFLGELVDYNNEYQEDEVDEIFYVPLDYFFTHEPEVYHGTLQVRPEDSFPFDAIPQGKKYPWSKGTYDVYFYRYEGRIIWGLTAKIIAKNLDYLKLS